MNLEGKLIVPSHKGMAVVVEHLMTDYGSPSTYYSATVIETNEPVLVHENIVEGIKNGTLTHNPFERKARAKKEGPTQKDRVREIVAEAQSKSLSRGETLKLIVSTLNVSKNTASTYYYAVR